MMSIAATVSSIKRPAATMCSAVCPEETAGDTKNRLQRKLIKTDAETGRQRKRKRKRRTESTEPQRRGGADRETRSSVSETEDIERRHKLDEEQR